MRIENVPDPVIKQPSDAIVRITHACICGSDLWFYRGLDNWQSGWRTGHEWMGIVEEVGSEVRNMKKGDTFGGVRCNCRSEWRSFWIFSDG